MRPALVILALFLTACTNGFRISTSATSRLSTSSSTLPTMTAPTDVTIPTVVAPPVTTLPLQSVCSPDKAAADGSFLTISPLELEIVNSAGVSVCQSTDPALQNQILNSKTITIPSTCQLADGNYILRLEKVGSTTSILSSYSGAADFNTTGVPLKVTNQIVAYDNGGNGDNVMELLFGSYANAADAAANSETCDKYFLPCTPSTRVENDPCGPVDVEERIFRTIQHVCDGSNNGAGQDVVVANDTSRCQGHSPLVLDLDGSGLQVLSPQQSHANFDLLNDGTPVRTAWVGPHNPFLVLDRNGDGTINNRFEMFGNMRGAANGFEDLAAFDLNDDGKIDRNDPVYSKLLLWFDLNGDGISQPNELVPLSESGIASISVRSAALKNTFINGQWISNKATFHFENGKTGKIYDIWFHTLVP